MEKSKYKVLISGAGVAGIACAILLDKKKYDVELIEQADQFRNIGFSIILWKTGFQHLTSLLQQRGVKMVEGEDCFPLEGFNIFAGPRLSLLKRITASGYAWAFERKRLMEILQEALFKEMRPEQISFARSIRHIEYSKKTDNAAVVSFRDGMQKEYDFVLIAEGIHSHSRGLIAVKERIVSVPYALRYAWFSSLSSLGAFGALFFSQGHVAVIHPPYFKNLLGFYFDKGTPKELQAAFINQIGQHIRDTKGEQCLVDMETSEVFELKEVFLDKYYARNVVLLGDAAHGRPPTLGFGTSLALEDATFLASKLNSLQGTSSQEVEDAFCVYSDARIKRVRSIYRIQDQIQKFYSKSSVKIVLLMFLVKLFYGSYVEYKIKKLAYYEHEKSSN